MNNGTLEFVKHKFDLLICILVASLGIFLAYLGYRFHDPITTSAGVTVFTGVAGAVVNMATNRSSSAERAADIPNTVTKTTTETDTSKPPIETTK